MDIYYFNAETLIGTFNPRRCADYYNDPSLLDTDIKQVLLTSGCQEWAKGYRSKDVGWESDFKLLLRNFVNDKALNYGVLEKWCSRSDYQDIDDKDFARHYPEKDKPIIPGQPTIDIVHWKIKQTNSVIEVGLMSDRQWVHATANLIFPFLFYNFHALQAKAVNYKLYGGFCESKRCDGNLYLTRTTGSKTKFCSDSCRTFTNVRSLRKRRKEGELMQA